MIQLKEEKCRISHVLRQKQPIKCDYSLNGTTFKTVDHHKHLGVTVSETLSCDQRVSSICAKARRTMELIRRSLGYKFPVAVETAFKVFVRPSLEYYCAVWNPYLIKHTNVISQYNGEPRG